MGLLEGLLQGLQLLGGEGRATAPLLSVLGAVASLKDDVLKCAAVEKQERRVGLIEWVSEAVWKQVA